MKRRVLARVLVVLSKIHPRRQADAWAPRRSQCDPRCIAKGSQGVPAECMVSRRMHCYPFAPTQTKVVLQCVQSSQKVGCRRCPNTGEVMPAFCGGSALSIDRSINLLFFRI